MQSQQGRRAAGVERGLRRGEGVGRVVVDAGVAGGGRRVYRVGVDGDVCVCMRVYAWTRARCVAMRCSNSGSGSRSERVGVVLQGI